MDQNMDGKWLEYRIFSSKPRTLKNSLPKGLKGKIFERQSNLMSAGLLVKVPNSPHPLHFVFKDWCKKYFVTAEVV